MVRPPFPLRWLPGRLAYMLVGFRWGWARPRPALVRLDGREYQADHYEIHVGNGRFCGGGAQFTPAAELDDGLLDVTRLHSVSRLRNFLTMLAHLQRGTLKPQPGVDIQRSKTVEIEQEHGFPVYLDGDWREVVAATPEARANVRIELVPSAIDVICHA